MLHDELTPPQADGRGSAIIIITIIINNSLLFCFFQTAQQGTDHASTKDVVGILAQLGGPEIRAIEPVVDAVDATGGGGDGRDPPTKGLEAADGEKPAGGGVQSGGGGGAGGGTDANNLKAAGLSSQGSGASLLSQFPATQAMPRAVTQSPIPLPPGGGEREQVAPEDDDAMRMSPPATAAG